jgi:hypothetical protein
MWPSTPSWSLFSRSPRPRPAGGWTSGRRLGRDRSPCGRTWYEKPLDFADEKAATPIEGRGETFLVKYWQGYKLVYLRDITCRGGTRS